MLGVFILWFGWYGFSKFCGDHLLLAVKISNSRSDRARIILQMLVAR